MLIISNRGKGVRVPAEVEHCGSFPTELKDWGSFLTEAEYCESFRYLLSAHEGFPYA